MLLDRYLVDSPERSVRVFRVYRAVPPHYHRGCDEVLYVLSGRGRFRMGAAGEAEGFKAGDLLCFPRGTVHGMPEIEAGPGAEAVVFLAIDTPRREPGDVVFADAADGTAAEFIRESR